MKMEEAICYKFWKQINNTAIYVSECGGVATISKRGLHFLKENLSICPAMKAKYISSAYPIVQVSYSLNNTLYHYNFHPHRAVAEVYLHPKNLFEMEVDHLDGNIINHHRLNLEWVTHEENIRRAAEARKRKKGGVKK